MPVLIQCPNPNCARTSSVGDELLGRGVRCRHCGTRFTASASDSQHGTKPPGSKSTSTSGSHKPLAPRTGVAPLAAIGRFEIRERLGSGAAGTVYRAYDPQLDREVAIKVPMPGSLHSEKRVQRFLREARAAARLRHPNIVPVYEAGQDGENYFIAAAYVAGKPLSAAVTEKGMSPKRAVRLVRDVALAVAYAHDQGIVHRDIKPANVMLDADDNPHLMDFGLASRNDDEEQLTQDGAILGTPAYMAPEMAAGQQGEAKPSADQYSLGILLYELLTGRPPFDGPPAVVLYNAIHTEPKPPSEIQERVPEDVETICLKAIAKDPEERYSSVQALADDLAHWLRKEPIEATPPPVAPEGLVGWLKANPLLAGGALAAAVVVLALGSTLAYVLTKKKPIAAPTVAAKPEPPPRVEPVEAKPPPHTTVKTVTPPPPPVEPPPPAGRNDFYVRVQADEKPPDGALLRTFEGHTDWVTSLVFSADGSTLVTGSYDTTVRVWNTATGATLRRLTGHRDAVVGVAVSPKGQFVASVERFKDASRRGLRLWDLEEKTPRSVALGGQASVAFNFGGTTVACTGADVSDADAAPGVGKVPLPPVAGDPSNVVSLWDIDGNAKGTLTGHRQAVLRIACHPKGVQVATADQGGAIHIYNPLEAGEVAPSIEYNTGVHVVPVYGLTFNRTGDRLVSCDKSGTVAVWHTSGAGLLWSSNAHTSSALSVAVSPDGNWVASAGLRAATVDRPELSEVRLLDMNDSGKVKTYVLRGHDRLVRAVAFATLNGKPVLATASYDNTVKLWDLKALLAVPK